MFLRGQRRGAAAPRTPRNPGVPRSPELRDSRGACAPPRTPLFWDSQNKGGPGGGTAPPGIAGFGGAAASQDCGECGGRQPPAKFTTIARAGFTYYSVFMIQCILGLSRASPALLTPHEVFADAYAQNLLKWLGTSHLGVTLMQFGLARGTCFTTDYAPNICRHGLATWGSHMLVPPHWGLPNLTP